MSNKNYESLTVGIGIGGLGIDASVAVFNLGSVLDATSQSVLTASDGSSMGQTISDASDPTSSLTALNGYQSAPNSSNTVSTTGSSQTSGNSAAVQAGVMQAQALVAGPTTSNTAASSLTATVAPTNGTLATIGNGAQIHAGSIIDVQAKENVIATLTAGGGTAGGIAVGASVAILNIDSDLQAIIGSGASLFTSGTITVNAALVSQLTTSADAAGAGTFALGAQVAIINDKSTEIATIEDNAQINGGSALNLTASATRVLSSVSNDFANIGAAAAGAAVAEATAGGTTAATIGSNVQVGQTAAVGSMSITAMDTSSVTTSTHSLTGGIGTALVNVNQATINPTVEAKIGSGSDISSTGAVNVTADAAPTAVSNSFGVSVSLGLAIAAVVSQAVVSPNVKSYIDDETEIRASQLLLKATLLSPTTDGVLASASSTAGSGGILLAAEGVAATAETSGTVAATTGSGLNLPNGNIAVIAQTQTSQSTNATAGTAGIVAAGAAVAESTSNVTTSAMVGAGVITSPERTGSLTITAMGTDTYVATSVAGSGAIVGVDASVSMTQNDSTVTAGLNRSSADGSSAASQIYGSDFIISATRSSNYSPVVNTINASVVGGSASVAQHNDSGNVAIDIGDNTTLTASGNVQVLSSNSFLETTTGSTANAGAGGGINGVSATSESQLTGSNTIDIGDTVTISSGTNPYTKAGGILVLASSSLQAADSVTLTTGGLIEGTGVNSKVTGSLANAVAIGSNATFTSHNNIGVGTYSTINVETNGASSTNGLAAAGAALAETTITSNQSVTIGDNGSLTAYRNVNLTAGNDPTGVVPTTITAYANATATTEAVAGIPGTSATATVTSDTSLTINNGVAVNSGQDITIGAYPGTPGVAESTLTKYTVLFIPITESSSNNVTPTTSATVVQNGTLTAGIYHTLDITIDTSGVAQINQGLNPAVPYLVPQPNGLIGTFNPFNFIATYFSPSVAPVLQSGVANTEVQQYLLGSQALPLYPKQVSLSTSGSNPSSIDLAYNHGYQTGDPVVYRAKTGSAIGGLVSGRTYYAIVNATYPTQLQLAETPNGSAIAFQSAGDGGQSLEDPNSAPLFASGGSVSVNADSLSGSGQVTAYGGAAINVTNNSPAYLLLGAIEIPNNTGGSVSFTGSAQLPSGQVQQINASVKPSVTISQTYDQAVGGVDFGPALFLTSPVFNVGGSVAISNTYGSYGQLGAIRAYSVDIQITNGTASIDQATTYALEDENAQWSASLLWPGGNPYAASYTANANSATAAISYVVNALYQSDIVPGDPSELNADLYWHVGKVGSSNTVPASIVFVGDSFPYVTDGDSGALQNTTWSGMAGYEPAGWYQVGSEKQGAYFPLLPIVSLSSQTPTTAAAPSTSNAIQVFGGGVGIQAPIIDLNGTISVGEQSNWSVQLTSQLAQSLSDFQAQYDSGAQTNPIYLIPTSELSTVSAGDNQITGSYSALTRLITLDDVTATLHGGYVSLHGKIISSNPQGLIQFNDGLGQVTIDNDTGIGVVIQQINTGNGAQSQLSITDTQKPPATQQTVYLYRPGQNVEMYVGAAGASLSTMQHTTLTGSTASYAPQADMRWVWENTAQLRRTQLVDLSDDLYSDSATMRDGWLSDWGWDTAGVPSGSANPWLTGAGSLQSDSTLSTVALQSGITSTRTSTSLPESLNATVPNQSPQYSNSSSDPDLVSFTPYQYDSDSYGYNNFNDIFDHHNYWGYYWPLTANLTQSNSLKAD